MKKLLISKVKKGDEVFFGKVVGLHYLNLLKWNSVISAQFLGITEVMFWCIFENSCYMESLEIVDNLYSSPLMIFLDIAYIFMHSHKNGKISQLLCIFLLQWFSCALFLLSFHQIMFWYSSLQLLCTLVLLFNLYTECKFWLL